MVVLLLQLYCLCLLLSLSLVRCYGCYTAPCLLLLCVPCALRGNRLQSPQQPCTWSSVHRPIHVGCPLQLRSSKLLLLC